MSARLAGAVVESMAEGEIASAETSEGDGSKLLVRLKPSASRPHNEFGGTERKVWGARDLLQDLDGPVRVAVGEDGALGELEIRVQGYQTFPTTAEENVVDEGVVAARMSPTDLTLEIQKPNCQAIE